MNAEAILETERLTLEPLRPDHAAVLYPDLREPRLYTFIPQDPPESPEALAARYTDLARRASPDGEETWLNWAVRLKDSGVYVGTFEATIDREFADLAYFVFRVHWRWGYAKEACARVIRFLFEEPGLECVSAAIDTRNRASIALVRSLGFRRAGVHYGASEYKGRFHDEYEYDLWREEWRPAASSAAPRR